MQNNPFLNSQYDNPFYTQVEQTPSQPYTIPNSSNYGEYTPSNMYSPEEEASILANTEAMINNTQPQTTEDSLNQGNVQEDIAALKAMRGQRAESKMSERSWNILSNIVKDAEEAGTGLTYMLTHGKELLSQLPQAAQDYYNKNGYNPTELVKGTLNLLLENYNIDLDTLDERTARDIIGGVVQGAIEHPLFTLMDVASFGGAGVIRNIANKVPVLNRLAKAGKVESRIASESVEGSQKVANYTDKLREAEQAAKDAGVKFEDVLKAAEEGTKLPEGGLESYKKLKEAAPMYDELVKNISPETYRGMESTAINQKILRERLRTNPSATFDEVVRDTTPLMELVEDGKYAEVLTRAKQGNQVAKEIVGAKTLYDKGRIIPITHAMAEIEQVVPSLSKIAETFVDAGRFSTRVAGNSNYEALAKALKNPDEFLEKVAEKYTEKNIAGSILRGEFIGQGETLGDKIKYLSRTDLESGKLSKALDSASKELTAKNNVPISESYLGVIRDQVNREGNLFTGALKDIYNVQRGNLLAGGTYVFGNMITGASNAVLNSGAGIIGDMISAIKSKGELARQLGVYRRNITPRYSNKIIEGFDKYSGNRLISRPLKYADRSLQNFWAEMAAHQEMRRAGVKYGERLNYISQADKAKLGDMITNIRRAALINSPKTILPKTAEPLMAAVSPFWRWLDTATQSNIYMLKKNPLMANVALNHIIANIGFDKEMQNRLNLNVSLDKPFVSYKFDDKTGQIKESRIEFIPSMTSLKLADKETLTNLDLNPALGAIIQSVSGKNSYGGYLRRPKVNGIITEAVGTKRYEVLPDGEVNEIKGKGDEIIASSLSSIFAVPRIYNKTIAPMLAPLLSPNGKYYQPYGMSVFGSFTPNVEGGNVFSSGDPQRGRTIEDVARSAITQYDIPYYPERPQSVMNARRRVLRQHNRRINRIYNEVE